MKDKMTSEVAVQNFFKWAKKLNCPDKSDKNTKNKHSNMILLFKFQGCLDHWAGEVDFNGNTKLVWKW